MKQATHTRIARWRDGFPHVHSDRSSLRAAKMSGTIGQHEDSRSIGAPTPRRQVLNAMGSTWNSTEGSIKQMSNLDDFPRRDDNRRLQEISENAFEGAISGCEEFVVQCSDKCDYGVDYILEAGDAGQMTNVRVHVQLKGTNKAENSDGSISLSIARTNLNYLAINPDSIFVCYQGRSNRLLVRSVDDVVREYEHGDGRLADQSTVTVRFSHNFDQAFKKP